MNYTVVWIRFAEEELARIWNESADRRAIAEAANRIDRLLRTRPLEVGESRKGNVRILPGVPLAIYYHVSQDDRLVSILRVWEVKANP